MDHKDMHITMEIFHEVEVAWIPQHTKEKNKHFIDLSKDTEPKEVDTLLHILIGYSNFDLDKISPKEIFLNYMLCKMDRQDSTLPGGIHFEGDGYHIYPGCRCGVEQWWEIADIKLKKHSTGRIVKRVYGIGDEAGVEDALRDKNISIISFYPEEFHHFLGKLDRDFKDFLDGPLQRWMEQLAGNKARPFVRAFARCFRRPDSPFEMRNSITLTL